MLQEMAPLQCFEAQDILDANSAFRNAWKQPEAFKAAFPNGNAA